MFCQSGNILPDINHPIEFVKGIGPRKAELLKKAFNVTTIGDLIMQFPFRYIDKTTVKPINQVTINDEWVLIKAKVLYTELAGKGRGRLIAHVSDGSGVMELVWFQGIKYIETLLEKGKEWLFYGKINVFNGKINLPHPELETPSIEGQPDFLLPIYSSTEGLTRAGFNMKFRRELMSKWLNELTHNDFPEMIPEELIRTMQLPTRFGSIRHMHFPTSLKTAEQAKRRLIFEEFFVNQTTLIMQKLYRKNYIHGYNFSIIGNYFNKFYNNHLPFDLTNAQKRVIKEIRTDMGSGFQLNRLLQGDVGSGKTIVALMSALIAVDNGFQTCIMAPLEILAQQHYKNILRYTEPLGLKIALLTGTTKKKDREQILAELASGEISIIIGTHALIEPIVRFHKLGLVIIDEQHRFGVEQRAALWSKATPLPPHVIVMTATPIPRTLAMSVFGDLDVSIIDELPPGRKPIKTIHYHELKRTEMEALMRHELGIGRQVFVVFPLIEESEKVDLENLQMGYDRIFRAFPPPKYQISVVHGKMKAADKEYEMNRFIQHKTNILVATTVIEVGVDIPNASVMIIENADRFGLSQLHQLRGRVGRGAEQSYCVLMTGFQLTLDAKKRLKTMVDTDNGFTIAEVDMQLRGPGSIEGVRQSGGPDFRLANLSSHQDIFQLANEAAIKILTEDPKLDLPKNIGLRKFMATRLKMNKDMSKIG
ncbi:MAG: ATP-dependent DNA helicase RecG [Candidatus Parvibacillus calidus]|nr:MAG: ATP-dependent DNA helicase RecG [Candidatus Parvibacillus calidus]